jgi:hypothetical protein
VFFAETTHYCHSMTCVFPAFETVPRLGKSKPNHTWPA